MLTTFEMIIMNTTRRHQGILQGNFCRFFFLMTAEQIKILKVKEIIIYNDLYTT